MNAIGYTRISTVEQSHHSLDGQDRLIREYCARHNLNLLAVFKDDGESSYTFDRPDWNALEAFIKKTKNVDCLVVVDLDRFSRNLAEALMKIQELQAKYKIRVLSTADNFDTDFEDPSNFMMRAFKLMMAEGELHNIRKRTKRGIIQAALSGRFTNMAPYGYKNGRDSKDKPILIIDETKAEIVRFIFREWLNGMEIAKLHRLAIAKGFKQKGKSSVQRILSNQVYYGMVPVPVHKGRKKPYEQGIHPAIISEQDFWLAQERLGNKKKAIHKNEEVPLRGVLHCWCGRKVTAGNSKSKTGKYHWYYLCQEHRKNLPATKLHLQFDEIMEALSISEAEMNWLRTKLMKEVGERIQEQGNVLARLKKELTDHQRQIKAAERRFLTMGNVSEETYKEVMAEMKADEVRLQREIAAQGTSHGAYFDKLNRLLPALCDLKDAFEKMPLEKQHQFINLGFDNSLSHDGNIYRTRKLHPLLAGKELELKENGLLVVEKPVIELSKVPSVPGTEPVSNFWDQTMQLLEAIA
jgi:site-specific DNA recombinase